MRTWPCRLAPVAWIVLACSAVALGAGKPKAAGNDGSGGKGPGLQGQPRVLAVQWSGVPVEPNEIRGQPVILIFWRDFDGATVNIPWTGARWTRNLIGTAWRRPLARAGSRKAWAMGRDLREISDLCQNAAQGGVRVVGVARDVTREAFVSTLASLQVSYPCALDAAAVTTTLYHIPIDSWYYCLVYDASGQMIAQGGIRQLRRGLGDLTEPQSKGPPTVREPPPPACLEVEALISQGRMAEALAACQKLVSTQDAAVVEYRQSTIDRIEATRAEMAGAVSKRKEAGQPWEAYRAAQAFLKSFPTGKPANDVKLIMNGLAKDPAVRYELEAERAFFAAAELLVSQDLHAQERGRTMMATVREQYARSPFGGYARIALGLGEAGPAGE